jgi:hypothetical protein
MKLLQLVLTVSAIIIASGAWAQSPSNAPEAIERIASQSKCAAYVWKQRRGVAPKTYIEGVALVFARAACHPELQEVRVVSAAVNATSNADDALVAYRKEFADAKMDNGTAGADTLRHAYALLVGLGMMESSGRYCEGRDVSECFATADTAEAGLFQTSFGAHVHSPALGNLFNAYKKDGSQCLLDVFKDSITCRIVKSQNPRCPNENSDVKGTGDGADWQRLTKACPAFATEYGAVVLRTHGGAHGEFGPIRTHQAELRPECDDMLRSVQDFVQQHSDVCSAM